MNKKIYESIKTLYPNGHKELLDGIKSLIDNEKIDREDIFLSEKDIILITYGDSIIREGELPLSTLLRFLNCHLECAINIVHLLPMFPFTSDDGFSVVDYTEINPKLGSWEEIDRLASCFDLMFDAVINHVSQESSWFKKYLLGDKEYQDYFIECNPNDDYSMVVRPRELPLYYEYNHIAGKKHIWATFSKDQVDINYKNENVLLKVLEILIMYAKKGARLIRFDAVGFIWKKDNSSCIHLEEAHQIIQIMRYVLDLCVPGTIIISETNVPHEENISYFGNGYNEAHMVYQFPLPPLTLFSILEGNAIKLNRWVKSLEDTKLTEKTTYFNFLASHDGIGMRPTEGILTNEEKQLLVNSCLENGGYVNFKINSDGTKSPYELNINYMDALTHPDLNDEIRIRRFIAATTILFSLIGVPGIYIHSLLGSRNWREGVVQSGVNRRINREKIDFDILNEELASNTLRSIVFNKYKKLLSIRKSNKEFSPLSKQESVFLDDRLFSIIRGDVSKILCVVNVSNETVLINSNYLGYDLISETEIKKEIRISPFQSMWIKIAGEEK